MEVFFSYAHGRDEELRNELEKHLTQLRRQGLISTWHDRRIEPGTEWASEIDSHVKSAEIILLLVSADFIASDYCYGVEMNEALERHRRHEAIVIPIILRPVVWDSAPFARIQALPRDGKAITTWTDRDEAFADVSRGIRAIVLRYASTRSADAPTAGATTVFSMNNQSVPKDRVLDAAIPSHLVKDQSTELLTKIRLPGSPGLVGTLLEDEEAEAKPEDVRSTEFDVVFPVEPGGGLGDLRVEITLTSPDFRPETQTKVMFVPPDADSDTCYFLLTPTRTGQLRALIELRWEEALRGSRRLKTECVATAESIPLRTGMSVVQMKLGGGVEKSDENLPLPPASAPRSETPVAVLDSEDLAFSRQSQKRAESERARETREAHLAAEKARRGETERRTSEEQVSAHRYESPARTTSYLAKGSAARHGWLTPAIVIAIIGAVSSISVGYLQFRPKPATVAPADPATVAPADPATADIVLRWQVINSETLEAVPDARVTVSFDSSVEPSEGVTDHAGTYSIKLNRSSVGSWGKVIVHADGFKPYSKDFAVSSNNRIERLWLDPASESPPIKASPPPITNPN